MNDPTAITRPDRLIAEMAGAQQSDGGWGYTASGTQSWVEPTAWALLALDAWGHDPRTLARGVEYLITVQNADGGWSNRPGAGTPSDSSTSRAVWALVRLGAGVPATMGLRWLGDTQQSSGGWGWCEGTVGFTEPAAYAALAYAASSRPTPPNLITHLVGLRCVDGGWGHHVARQVGVDQISQMAPTALAVLALAGSGDTAGDGDAVVSGAVELALAWAASDPPTTVYSLALLAWCLLTTRPEDLSAVALARRVNVAARQPGGRLPGGDWRRSILLYVAARAGPIARGGGDHR